MEKQDIVEPLNEDDNDDGWDSRPSSSKQTKKKEKEKGEKRRRTTREPSSDSSGSISEPNSVYMKRSRHSYVSESASFDEEEYETVDKTGHFFGNKMSSTHK